MGAVIALLCGCGRSQETLLLLDELPTVESIEIIGNEHFSDATLKKLMTLSEPGTLNPFRVGRFSPHQLELDVLAILTHYYRHGYLRAGEVSTRVTQRAGTNKVDIVIEIYEGEPVLVKGVSVRPAPGVAPLEFRGLTRENIMETLIERPGSPMDPFGVAADVRRIAVLLADEGYPFAKIRPNTQFQGNQALVFYMVDPGEIYHASTVVVEGSRHITQHQLRRDLLMKPGGLYRQSRIVKSQEKLIRSGYFSSVRWDTVNPDSTSREVGIRFRVTERKLNYVEGGVGINSENLLRLTGNWGNRSLFRTGLFFGFVNTAELALDKRVGQYLDYAETSLILRDHNLFGWGIEGAPGASFTYDKEPDYEQRIAGIGLSTRYYLGSGFRNQLISSLENRWVNNSADSSAAAMDPQFSRPRYQTRLLSGRVVLDSRNDFFNPEHGRIGQLTLEFAGGALGGNNDFVKATGNLSEYTMAVTDRLVLAGRVQLGAIDPLSDLNPAAGFTSESDLIPIEDRYVLGGATTVRGFEQDELDGRTEPNVDTNGGVVTFLGNLETRMHLFSRFSLVAFLDGGNVWRDWSDLTLSAFVPHEDPYEVSTLDVRYAYGLGLRFATPVGPVRVDYARKWNRPETLHEPPDRWHFVLGQAF